MVINKKTKGAALGAAFFFSVFTLPTLAGGFLFSDNSEAKLSSVRPELQSIVRLSLFLSSVDFGVSSGVRSETEQVELYKKGKTKIDGVKQKSKHQLGCAVDLFAYVDGKASYEKRHMLEIYNYMSLSSKILGHDIIWGGDWKSFVDMPHFELADC